MIAVATSALDGDSTEYSERSLWKGARVVAPYSSQA